MHYSAIFLVFFAFSSTFAALPSIDGIRQLIDKYSKDPSIPHNETILYAILATGLNNGQLLESISEDVTKLQSCCDSKTTNKTVDPTVDQAKLMLEIILQKIFSNTPNVNTKDTKWLADFLLNSQKPSTSTNTNGNGNGNGNQNQNTYVAPQGGSLSGYLQWLANQAATRSNSGGSSGSFTLTNTNTNTNTNAGYAVPVGPTGSQTIDFPFVIDATGDGKFVLRQQNLPSGSIGGQTIISGRFGSNGEFIPFGSSGGQTVNTGGYVTAPEGYVSAKK